MSQEAESVRSTSRKGGSSRVPELCTPGVSLGPEHRTFRPSFFSRAILFQFKYSNIYFLITTYGVGVALGSGAGAGTAFGSGAGALAPTSHFSGKATYLDKKSVSCKIWPTRLTL